MGVPRLRFCVLRSGAPQGVWTEEVTMRGGPDIRHLDDVPAEEMLRFRFADGHTASIWEKWIAMSPRYVAFWNKWDPGAMTAQHGHMGDHTNLILKGEIRCGD